MIPTRVVFIIKIPSVKMEMSWVSLATWDYTDTNKSSDKK